MLNKEELNITEDEAAIYDRQIRLWGLDAQKRLRAAQILIISLNGLGAEVTKNLVLAGVKSVTLLDHQNVATRDLHSQLLLSRNDIGCNRAEASKPRVQLLNPMVIVETCTDDIRNKTAEFYQQFDVVCAFDLNLSTILNIADICHKNNISLFVGDVFGYYGGFLADLGNHEYAEEVTQKTKSDASEASNGEPVSKKPRSDMTETTVVKKTVSYSSLSNALSLDWCTSSSVASKLKSTPSAYFIFQALWQWKNEHSSQYDKTSPNNKQQLLDIRSRIISQLPTDGNKIFPENFIDFCGGELNPICAIVGGILAQEIIKCVSKKDTPLNNSFFYNGVDSSGLVDKIG